MKKKIRKKNEKRINERINLFAIKDQRNGNTTFQRLHSKQR